MFLFLMFSEQICSNCQINAHVQFQDKSNNLHKTAYVLMVNEACMQTQAKFEENVL